MIRALPFLLVATPALAASHPADGAPAFVSALAPLLIAGAGIWLARRAMRARARKAKD